VALGSTQPLTEMNTRNISWMDKGGRCLGLITLPPSCADCLEISEPQPPGNLRACTGIASAALPVGLVRILQNVLFRVKLFIGGCNNLLFHVQYAITECYVV
jgi:hypothetical protein